MTDTAQIFSNDPKLEAICEHVNLHKFPHGIKFDASDVISPDPKAGSAPDSNPTPQYRFEP